MASKWLPATWQLSGFQLSHLGLNILDGQLAALLSILDGCLQGSPLAFEPIDLSLDSADVLVSLRNLSLRAMHIIPVLSGQCLQLLILDLVDGFSLSPTVVGDGLAISSYWVLTSGMMSSRSRERLLSMDLSLIHI